MKRNDVDCDIWYTIEYTFRNGQLKTIFFNKREWTLWVFFCEVTEYRGYIEYFKRKSVDCVIWSKIVYIYIYIYIEV